MNRKKGKQLVADAKKIARRVDSWVEFSNALDDPNGGLIAHYFPDMEERRAFLRTPEYKQLDQLLLQVIKRKGLSLRRPRGKSASAR